MAIRDAVAVSGLPPSLPRDAQTVSELAEGVQRALAELHRSLVNLADVLPNRTRAVTAAYTVVDETVILADAGGGAFTVTLPPASESLDAAVDVKRMNAGVNLVTIGPSGADTIDGGGAVTLLAQYDNKRFICTSLTGWTIH